MERTAVFARVQSEVEALAGQIIEDPDTEIFKSGLLDSLNVLNIITFMEDEFSLKIDPFDLNLDTLGTINRVCDYVMMKMSQS